MPESTAQRTLVKSPPELWAEVSDAAALAKHLGEFGEIRITRLEPETTVAWEGDRASGTVKLEPSGWGTKVTLTAELADQPEPVAVEPEPEPVAVEPEPEPVEAEPEPAPPPPPPPPPAPAAEAPVFRPRQPAKPRPEPVPPTAKKPGFFARLFGRKAPPAAEPPAAPVERPAPRIETPAPEPPPAPPIAAVPAPEPPAPEPEPEPIRPPEPDPPEPPAAEADSAMTEDTATAVLTSVLDDLGSAHHRPFSRS